MLATSATPSKCLQLELEEPVLQRSQLGQIVIPSAIHQRVFVDPAHASRVRTESRSDALRQLCGNLCQPFGHPGARPIGVGPVVEQHVHE